MASDALRARESFVAAAIGMGGQETLVRVGDVFPSEHPVVKGREGFFEPVSDAANRATRAIERATAEPGVPRSLSRPARVGAKDAPPPAAERV